MTNPFEQPDSPEKKERITDEAVIEILKTQGAAPEALALLSRWIDQEYAEIESDKEHPGRKMAFMIRQAEIYHAGGLEDAARETLEDAQLEASQRPEYRSVLLRIWDIRGKWAF